MAVSIIETALLVIIFCSAGTAQIVSLQEGQPAGVVNNTSVDCQGEVSITSYGGFPYGIEFVNKTSPGHYQLNLTQSIKRPDCNKGNATCTHKSTQEWTLTYNCKSQKPIDIVVRIEPEDFCPPFFCNKSCGIQSFYEVTVNENTQIGTNIFEMKICDDDSELDRNPYEIKIDSQVLSPTFNTKVYNLKLNQSLDYDDTMTHMENITLRLIPRNTTDTVDTTVLLIKIEDFDDLNPAFTENVYACGIYEGVYNTSTQCLVEAYDQDMGIKATIEYMIHSVDPKEGVGMFSMSENGSLTIEGTLDRETVSNYFIIIKAFQENRPDDRFNFTTLVLTVLDKDDNPPVIHSSANTTSIMENANNGTIVFQLSVTDRDKNDTSVFNITDTSDAFHIDPRTGTVTVLQSNILDREKKAMFPLQVRAVSHNGTKTSLPLNLTVVLLDENDNSPIFDSNTNTTIQKTKSVNSTVLQVNATDEDDGLNGRVQYSLQTTGVPFAINSETGQIYVSESMNETFEAVYTILVQAEDQALQKTNRRFTSKTVTINVNDVNIHAPMFRGIRGNVSLSEAADIGSLISYLNATDQDPADTLRFNITEGNINGDFIINEHNYLSTKHRLDRETTSSYKLVIEVTDSIHSVRETINITVTDENDNDPVFKNPYMFEIEEETFGNFTVEATDDDIAENSRVEYSIDENSSWKLNFTIDKSTGILSTKGKLDKEALPAKENVTFTVYATDNGSPKRIGNTQVSVNVKDINDNGPMFPQHNTTLTLVELTQPRIVYTAQAVDKDATQENRGIVYKLKSEQPHSPFFMNRNGSLSINKPLKLDVIDDSKVVLQIQASNSSHQPSGNLYDTQTLTITIQDVNDHSPKFVNKSYTFNINETTPEGTHIGMASATDGDVTPVYNTVYYWTEKTAPDIIRIDTFTGSIYLANEYDCDTLPCDKPLELKIFSSDMQPCENGQNINNSVQVYINVLPVNEYSPIFSTDQYKCIVRDNYTGTFNCLVNATDEDSRKDGKIKYTITNHTTTKTNLQPFAINSSTGELTLTNALSTDPKRKTEYVLRISAEDNGDSPRKSFASVNIIVDGPPKIHGRNFISIPESNKYLHNGGVIGHISVLNNPERSTLNYSIINTTLNAIAINDYGYIQLNYPVIFDYEATSTYPFVVEVNDTYHSTKKEFTINILPVNDNIPTFPQNYSINNILENSVCTVDVKASDNDTGIDGEIKKYSIIISNEWSKTITINETSGQVLIQPIDRDTLGSESITFTVTAEDKGSPSLTGLTSVTIHVKGINDNAPYFLPEEEHVFRTVVENKAYSNFFTAKAYDKDIGNDSNIYYRVVNQSSAITIDNNGTMSLTPLKIDSSNHGELEVTIEAYNEEAYSNTNLRNATQILTLTIKDVNDEVPTFTQTIYSTTVSECCATGTSLLNVTATDKDPTRAFNTVTYWMEGEHNSSFIIDSRTGEIKLLKPLDYDAPINDSKFEFKVYATDLDNREIASNHTVHAGISITVTGCNDIAPKFSKDEYTCFVKENTIGAVTDCQIVATDGDSGSAKLHYNLENTTGSANFVFKNMMLNITKSLDYDTNGSKLFNLSITATDEGNKTATCSVTVSLTDINDNPPVIEVKEYSIRENAAAGTYVGQIIAKDKDKDSTLTYKLWDTTGPFTVNQTTGILAVGTANIDYETKRNYTISISVDDTVNTVNGTLTILVNPVNEYPPEFNKTHTCKITENVKEIVCSFQAYDSDEGNKDGEIQTYSLYPQANMKRNVTISNTTGSVTIHSMDREELGPDGEITLTITAQDGGHPPRTGITHVTLNIIGVNDNPPYYIREEQKVSFTLYENKPYLHFYTSKAFDKDIGPGSKVSYRIVNDTTYFNMSKDGTISAAPLAIDINNNGLIHLVIEAYNEAGGMANATQLLTIHIKGVNANVPVFNQSMYHKIVNECDPTGVSVLNVTATDKDTTKEFNTVTYWMEQSNSDNFIIDSRTGEIKLLKALNYDAPKNDLKFEFKVYATDLEDWNIRSNHTNYTNVTITVTGCNDNKPKFSKDVYNCSIEEGKTAGFGCRVTATDIDNDTVSYALVDTTQNHFKINNATGEVTCLDKLDFEDITTAKVFLVDVSASDKKYSSSVALLEIQLLNVNDEKPEFNKANYTFNVDENVKADYMIGSIDVHDPDGGSVQLHIDPNKYKDFYINSFGDIFSNKSFDFETTQVYYVSVEATDGNHTVKTNITVNILDKNDNAPMFGNGTYIVYKKESTPVNTVVVNVIATDNDGSRTNNVITYKILSGNTNGTFSLNQTTGAITAKTKFNCSVTQIYTLVVQATDNGDPKLSDVSVVTINIRDENNNPPYFVDAPYSAQVAENEMDKKILQIHAVDIDQSTTPLYYKVINNTHFYFTNNNLFANNTDAECCGAVQGKHEQITKMNISILVSDGQFNETTYVAVNISDVNDNTPYFVNEIFNLSINDTSKVGFYVTTIQANDIDISNDGFTYILHGSNGDFQINDTTGEIIVHKEKDRKWNKAYLYTMDVTVYDSGSPPKSNKTRLYVTIIETNKNAPKFLNTPIELQFLENNPNVSANIIATDDDSHNISYRIIPYDDPICIRAFKINHTCGTLTLANDSITLDYESLSKIDCIVVATDNAEFPKSSSTTVTINVEDVDEPPKLRIDPNLVYKAINATKGSIVAKVKVDDPDKSEKFRNFSYSITKDSDNDKFFEIDNNGTISTKDVLAVAGTFNVSITVTDGGGKTDTGKLTVIVSEVRGCNQDGSVFENATINTMISGLENFTDTCFNLSDIDRSMINFTIRHSSGYFGISNRSLVTLKTLDREQENGYIVVIAGNDKKTGILKTQIQAVISIKDINDCKPVFNKSSYAMSIKETQNETAWVGRVTASDEDEKPTLHYEVDKESSRTGFTIDDDGNIYTKPIDYDGNDKHVYNLTVICSDTIHSATTIVLITIEDVNDNPPKFTNDSYSFKVNESIATGVMPNVKVKANDPDTADEGKLEYTIVQGDTRNNFDIDNTGQFSLIKSLDYENMTDTNINLVVNVRDTDNHTTNVNVTLRVLDVNDNAPKFTKPEYTFKITEGINLTTNNFSVSVVDNDAGNNGQVTFSLKNGTDSAFSISTDDNNKQGFIHINKPLDRENASLHLSDSGDAVYSFTVVAIDHGEPKLSSSVLVSIHVSDINDCTPKFENDNYTVSILEGSRVGSNIVTITATDCDYKPNITYSLTGDANNTFNITQNGKLILNKVISMKDKGLYQLQIVAHDGSNAGKVNLTIKITDTNDHSPTFTQPIYTFNVSETNNNVTIGDVLAKDEDPDENGNVAYSITSGNTNTTFTIVKDTNGTGTITTLKSLDREQKSEYVLIITAKDNAEKGRQRQGTCTVSVVLLDVNDNYPVFNQPFSAYNGSVKENADNGTNVNMITKIRSTDSDKDINGTKGIIYTLYDSAGSGSTEMPFCIEKKTGIVYVCGNVDREAKSNYSLSINATDSDGKGLTTTANLTIYVVDINDETPQFPATPYMFSILENVTAATSVGQIKVADKDINGLQNIKFQIIHGDDEKFYIDNNGTIRVSGKLDRESKPMYTLTVQANDGRNTNKLNVTVILLDINDNTPLFNESSIEINVVENSSPGFIYNVSAYDKDEANSNNSEIEFSLNETSDVFSITKEGFISTTRSLDREKSPSYFLTVVAKDHGSPPLSSSIPVHVHILDLNDNYPVFYHHGQRNVSVIRSFTVEKSPVNSVIALPVANDTDFKKNGTITYSIEPVNKYFRIDANTGLVQLNKSIEINTLVQENTNITRKSDSVELNITIVATDGGGKNTTLLLIVTVEEINDNAPVFQNSFFKFNVDENLNDTFVGNCVATIPNATFTHMSYRLLPDESNFLININNGTIKTKTPLDREELSHYTLAVQVKDGRTPERTAFAAVEITVNDANDNAPLFLNGNMVLNIEENTNWTRQTYVTAADKDVGDNALIVYTLDNDFENRFQINQSSGLLKVNGTFDREQDTEYVLHVLAKDSGTPSLNTTTTVTINVLDENDNPPVFYDVINNVTVKENATGTVFTVHANDSDSGLNGSVVYNLVNAEEETFEINQLSGTVSISGKLDFEKRRNHTLGIEACDQGIKPKCAYRNVSVHIVDVFDFVPKFEKQVYETTLNWTVPVATEVIKVNAGSGGNVKYTLAGDDSVYFTINVTSGQITTAQELNRHTKDYVFTVNAIDESSRGHKQSATSKVIVHISDHAVVFPENEYQAVLPENMNSQSLLIDLNTTDEINGLTVLYSILKISPNVSEPDVFRISETDGKVYCEKPLDREAHSQYTIYISATSVVSTLVRNKRDIHIDRSASTIKLIINVTDVNDSPPTFPVSQQKVFGVPSDARANYIVARLKATDADSGDNAKTFYRLLSHDNMTKFSIDPSSGDVKTNVAMASLRRTNFTFTVIAEDAADGNQSTTIDIKIVVIPRNARLQLQTNISFAEFRRRQHEIIEELNNLLGVDVQLENLVPHLEGTSIMLTRTDMTFHGINRTTGNVVPYNEMMRLIQNTSEKVNKLLGNTVSWSVTVVSKPTNVDPSAITTSQIVLICMAIFIFFGSLVAILIAQYSWTRYDQDTDQREKLMQEYQFEDIELDSMKSRRSSKMSSMNKAGAAAINPAFLDTEFKGTLSNGMKSKPVYESQELRMNFDEEPISDNLPIALGPSEINATISIDDSGVENTSDHSSDRYKSSVADKDSPRENRASNNLLIAGEGPVMTSSPRVSHEGALVFDAEMIRPGPSNEILNKNDKYPASRINLRIDIGETETDDELDSENDEMNCSETEQQNVDKKDNKLNGVTKVKKTVDFVETVEEISNEEDEVTSF